MHEYDLAEDFEGQALHAGAFELYLQDGARCRLAQLQDWGAGEVFDVSTRFVGVGRDAYCHWLPALLGGHLVRQHLELAVTEPGGDMAFRGLFFTEEHEHLDVFAVDLHETGPSGGDVHWRGAATGESRASFEGLIQIDPGAQQTHTYLQIHSMMLSPKARIDAIPSVLVSADDVSASHGGTVGELDEAAIFYMQSRGLDRAGGGARDRRGLLRAADRPSSHDEPLQELVRAKIARKLAAAREDIEALCRQSLSTLALDVRADFPILAREFDGRPLVYLDSAATSQKPAGRDRGARRAPAQPQRQRPPRRLRARAGGRRGLRGARARGSRRSPAPSRARRSSPRTSPRRSTSSPTRGAAPTSAPATRC